MADKSQTSEIDNHLKTYLIAKDPENQVKASKAFLIQALRVATTKELIEMNRTIENYAKDPKYNQANIKEIQKIINDQMDNQLPMKSPYQTPEKRIVKEKNMTASSSPNVPESARKSVATLCIGRTLEKKVIKNLFNTIQNMRENVFNVKLNETTQRTNTTDSSPKRKGIDPNKLAKGLVLLSQTTITKDLEHIMFYKWKAYTFAQTSSNMNTSAILGEYYKKQTHSPIPSSNRGAISNLTSKLPERTNDYAQKQSIAFMHKVGIGMITKVVLVHLTKCFCKIKEVENMDKASEKCRLLLIKVILNRQEVEVKRAVMNCFHKWRTHSISEAFTKGRITNKVKGRLLVSLSKKQSSISLETALLRWKVKSDPSFVRKAIERFALNTKLTPHLALWKMKAGALARKEKVEREQRSNFKLVKGLQNLSDIIQRYNHRQLTHALVNIDEYKFTLALRKKCVMMFRRFLQRGLVQAMEKWKQACIQQLLSDLRKKAVKGLVKAPNHLQLAFGKWKSYALHATSKIEKFKSLKGLEFANKMEDFVENLKSVAWGKLKGKVRKFKLAGQITQNLIFRVRMRLKQSLYTWREQLFNSKLAKQKKIENIQKIFEFMKMKRKLELQKAIHAVKATQMSIQHKNQRLAMLVVQSMTTKIRSSLRIWHLKKDISKYLDISKKCNLLMTALSRSLRQNTNLIYETESVNKQYVCLKNLVDSYKAKINFGFIKWKTETKRTLEANRVSKEKSARLLVNIVNKPIIREKRSFMDMLYENLEDISKTKTNSVSRILHGIQRKFEFSFRVWKTETRNEAERNRKKNLQSLFELMQDHLKYNTTMLYRNEQENKKRIQAIKYKKNMIKVRNNLQTKAFALWKTKTRFLRLQANLYNTELEKNLEKTAFYLQEKLNQTLKTTFQSIRETARENKVKKRAILNLMKNSKGILLYYFDKWKKTPKNSYLHEQKGIVIMDKILLKIFTRNMRAGFDPLKEVWHEIDNIKRKSIIEWIHNTEDKTKRAFHIWVKNAKDVSKTLAIKTMFNLFETLNEPLKANVAAVLTSDQLAMKREEVLKKIVSIVGIKKKFTFEKWKNFMISRRFKMEITTERKKRVAFGIFQMMESVVSDTKRMILDDLVRHKWELDIKTRVINMWMRTRIGKILRAFELWKRLPSKRLMKKKESSANFVSTLEEILRTKKKQTFDRLKDLWYESREIKRKVLRHMLYITSNQRKLAIDKWRHHSRTETHILKCRDVLKLFENMNAAIKTNLSVLTYFDINRERKEKVLRQIMNTRKLFMKFGFDKWKRFNERENVKEMMGNQKKDFMLNRLERYAIKGLMIRKSEGFKGFQEHRRECNLKIRVLKHLLNTRAGKIAKAFDIWKRLPTKRELNKLNSIADLDAILKKFAVKRKLHGFDEMKKLWYDSREKKKACLKKWIYLSLNKKKRTFATWAQNAEKIKTIQNCKNISTLFEVLSIGIKENTNLLYNKGYDSERKMDILRKIIANSHSKRVQFFNLWHKFTLESRFIEHIVERNKDLSTEKIQSILFKGLISTKKIAFQAINQYSTEMGDKKRIILSLKKTVFYRLAQSFRKWKNTAEQIKILKENSSKTLDIQLTNLMKISLKWGFDAIRNKFIKEKNHAINISKRIIFMWTAKQRKAVNRWKESIEQTKKENRIRDAQNLLEIMKEAARFSTVEIYSREVNYQQKKNTSKLFSILTRIFNQRVKSDFDNLQKYKEFVVDLKLRVFKALDQNSSSRARESLSFWKQFTKKSKEAANVKNALILFGVLEYSLKQSTAELYDYSPIDYGKKMILKQLYNNWASRKSALFNRWKENVNKQKLLERALTFGKIIITCRKNREYVLKEGMRLWRRNSELIKFKTQTAQIVKTKDITTRTIAAVSRIEVASSKFLLRSFKKIQINSLRKKMVSLLFSKLEERHIYLKNTGFERIKASNRQNYGFNMTKSVLNGHMALEKYARRMALYAFDRIRELKVTDKKIWKLGDIFRKGLLSSFNKWRLSSKHAIITRMSNYCVELQEEVKETHKQAAHHQTKSVKNNSLNIIFLALEKAVNGSMTVAIDALKDNKHDWDKKAIYFNRMEQVAKFKKSYVFEIWKSMCTEKLLKSFYDTILLEKSLLKYVSNLKFFAFHRIRTTGILEYWRTYNNALWKWKLSNVEARYYTQQNTFLKQAKSVSIMKLIIEVTQRNVLRDAFLSIFNYKLRNPKELKISFNSLEKLYKTRLSDYFNQIKIVNTVNSYEEDIKMNKLAAGLAKLGNVFNRDNMKEQGNLLTSLQQTVYQRKKVQRLGTILDRFVFNLQYFGFNKLKTTSLFVDRKSYVDLKTQTLFKYLELYQNNLARSAISKIKNYLMLQRKLVSIRNSLSHILAKCKGRGILRKWLVKSRLRDQIKATKFVKMISLIGKNREHILRRALRKWSFKRGKNVLDIFSLVLKRYVHFTYKQVFDKIKQRVEMFKYLNKVLATQKIMRFKRLFLEYRTFVAFKTWYDRTKNYNPWFKRSVALIAKNSKINYQIAFWRLRDAVKVEGSNLTASKVVKCKKIINFVKKLYEMNIAKAFWMIERRGKNDNDDEKNGSGKKNRNGETPEKKKEEREEQTKRKVIKSILGRIVKKYGPTRQNILSGAFTKWCMKAGIGRKVVMQKLADSMRDYEMDYVAKYGAMHILFNTIKNLANKNIKDSFEKISNFNSTNGLLNQRNWNDVSGDMGDADKNFLVERHQELLNAYEEKSRHLEQAYQSLTHLSNRLNAMITTKFVKILNKYRVVNLLEAFESIRESSETKE